LLSFAMCQQNGVRIVVPRVPDRFRSKMIRNRRCDHFAAGLTYRNAIRIVPALSSPVSHSSSALFPPPPSPLTSSGNTDLPRRSRAFFSLSGSVRVVCRFHTTRIDKILSSDTCTTTVVRVNNGTQSNGQIDQSHSRLPDSSILDRSVDRSVGSLAA